VSDTHDAPPPAPPPATGTGGPNGPEYDAWSRCSLISAAVGGVAFAAFAGITFSTAGSQALPQLTLSYLVGVVFWLGIAIGSIVLLLIQYLTGGQWGVLLRRPARAATRTLPLLAVLFIPIVLTWFSPGASPYWWATDPTAHGKEAAERAEVFLFPSFAAGRTVGYFAFWLIAAALLNVWGAKSEAEARRNAARGWLEALAGPGLMLHAAVMTFAVTDWVMSLEPSWSSTMFPVIFGVTQILAGYTFGVALLLTLARRDAPLAAALKPVPHQIDLGSFMLALTCFWTYVCFSQFMLVWIGNLPEEIPYYLKRTRGGWEYVAYALFAFHFVLPFVLLLFRDIKWNPKALRAVAIGLVVVCALDTIWWTEPSMAREGFSLFPLLDLAALTGVGGLWGWWFVRELRKAPLLPEHEVYLLDPHHHPAHGHAEGHAHG
jgi:hypothetical protein